MRTIPMQSTQTQVRINEFIRSVYNGMVLDRAETNCPYKTSCDSSHAFWPFTDLAQSDRLIG